ncbi:MAG: chemotaxis protein CheB [Spongiibacteraceae bacterium]|nr:chemotaxis protein CheB [Spongiibacteraceae bacterium]
MQSVEMPRIGLVTDSAYHRKLLQTLLEEKGYPLSLSLNPQSLRDYLEKESSVEVDAWLVDLIGDEAEHTVEFLVEKNDLPLLVNDEIPPLQDEGLHEEWQRRLLEKLEVVAHREDLNSPVANTLWVLAASLGGPDAVKRFLGALPEGLALAMVYAQHIEINFDELLANAVGSNHTYTMRVVRSEQRLLAGEIAVVPADRQLRFLPFGRVVVTQKPWSGLYQPAIDQVIADLARIYRQRLGVIIFSGLCNDGEIGCRVAKACGAKVWAQTPESCQSPEMVEAAIATGCVSFQGTPEQLAQALAKHYNENN